MIRKTISARIHYLLLTMSRFLSQIHLEGNYFSNLFIAEGTKTGRTYKSLSLVWVRRQNDLQSKEENLRLLHGNVMLKSSGSIALCLIIKTLVPIQACLLSVDDCVHQQTGSWVSLKKKRSLRFNMATFFLRFLTRFWEAVGWWWGQQPDLKGGYGIQTTSRSLGQGTNRIGASFFLTFLTFSCSKEIQTPLQIFSQVILTETLPASLCYPSECTTRVGVIWCTVKLWEPHSFSNNK